jgi:hypothetical protein
MGLPTEITKEALSLPSYNCVTVGRRVDREKILRVLRGQFPLSLRGDLRKFFNRGFTDYHS